MSNQHAPTIGKLFHNLSTHLTEELVTILAENQHVRIERIVSTGQTTAANEWYDQDEHEWVVLLTGHATLLFENGEPLHLLPGDHITISAHQKHRVEATSADEPTVWLAVFYT